MTDTTKKKKNKKTHIIEKLIHSSLRSESKTIGEKFDSFGTKEYYNIQRSKIVFSYSFTV